MSRTTSSSTSRTTPPKMRSVVALADGFTLTDQLNTSHRLAFKDDFQVYIARADGRERRPVFSERKRSTACPLAWSRDGRTLYEAHDQIYAVDVATGDAPAITAFPEEQHFSVTWNLSLSPDGRTLFFRQTLRERERPDWRARLCTISTDGTGFRVVQDHPPDGHLWFADVHWESRRVVVAITQKGGGDYWLTDLDGGDLSLLCEAPSSTQPSLSPDGSAFVCSGDQGLYLFSVPDGKPRKLSRAGNSPAWSPDGRRIAFMNEDYELWLLEPESGNLSKIAWMAGRNIRNGRRGGSYATEPVWSPDGRLLWFRLTKTHRLRKPRDPDAVEKFKASTLYQGISEEQREAACRRHMEQQYWHFSHKYGVVDFSEHKVWLTEGHCRDVAWSW